MTKTTQLESTLNPSAEAERAILGAVLLDATGSAFNQAASRIRPDDFLLHSHRLIYRAMDELFSAGSKVDFVTLCDRLARRGELEAIGGTSYVTNLTDGLPRVRNITHYVEIVREKSRAAMLLNLMEVGSAQIREGDPADEVLADVQQRILPIIHHGRAGKTQNIVDISREAIERLHAIRNMDGVCVGLSTGLEELDVLTTGYRDGEFYVIGARPGAGKTAFMCQAVRKNCKAGRKVAVFSIEVERTQIINRLAAMETSISVFDLRDPRGLNDSEMLRIEEAIGEIAQWPLLLEDSPRLDCSELSAISRLFISQGAEIIFVDFLQKLRAPGKTDFDRVTATADALWELGRSTGIPVVALSQLRRGGQNADEPPTMDDLRQSGQIEQNANAVFLLYRPREVDSYSKKRRFTGLDQIILGKQRSGPADTHIPVRFNGHVGIYEWRLETEG